VFRLDEAGLALFRLGAEAPGLLVRQRPAPAAADGGPRVWLEVTDARVAAATLVAAGVSTLGEPFTVATGWTVEIADPWGNILGFTDYTTMPERARPA
jgi:predicted enzyme related to lactoylglutathione lyase